MTICTYATQFNMDTKVWHC